MIKLDVIGSAVNSFIGRKGRFLRCSPKTLENSINIQICPHFIKYSKKMKFCLKTLTSDYPAKKVNTCYNSVLFHLLRNGINHKIYYDIYRLTIDLANNDTELYDKSYKICSIKCYFAIESWRYDISIIFIYSQNKFVANDFFSRVITPTCDYNKNPFNHLPPCTALNIT